MKHFLSAITIFAALFSANRAQYNQFNQCPLAGEFVPASLDVYRAASQHYPFVEGGLQIFRNRQIECDGWLHQWLFISQSRVIFDTYLAVFREREPGSLLFDIVGQTYIQLARLPERTPGTFDVYQAYPAIRVKTGDYLGLYYKKFDVGNAGLSIVTERIDTEIPIDYPLTHVLLLDALHGVVNGGLINATFSSQDSYRNPALTAHVLPQNPDQRPSTQPPATMPWLPPVTQEIEPSEPETPTFITEQTPEPIQEPINANTGLIPYRCLLDLPAENSCLVKQRRNFFDFQFGDCRSDYGCVATAINENQFGSIDECRAVCFSLLSGFSSSQAPPVATQRGAVMTPPTLPPPGPPGNIFQSQIMNQQQQPSVIKQPELFTPLPTPRPMVTNFNPFNVFPVFFRQQGDPQRPFLPFR